jgi:midasin (ATPase involved in ribosome maturation)
LLPLLSKDHALGETTLPNDIGESSSRKRRKVADEELTTADLQTLLQEWDELQKDVDTFELQHVKAGGKLVFAFVEGPLVQALRCGEW